MINYVITKQDGSLWDFGAIPKEEGPGLIETTVSLGYAVVMRTTNTEGHGG